MIKELSKSDGMKMLPCIWNLYVTNSSNGFIDPFSLRSLRHRCFFEKSNGIINNLLVFFHLTAEEEAAMTLSPNVYLYGAFNQVDVNQMRSCGRLRKLDRFERDRFIEKITNRLDGKKIGDKLSPVIGRADKQEVLQLLQSGNCYCFEPLKYAYQTYARG